jgi:hypothetical protein
VLDQLARWCADPELARGDAAVGPGEGRGDHQPGLAGDVDVEGVEVTGARGRVQLGEQVLVETGDPDGERSVTRGDVGRDQPLPVVVDVEHAQGGSADALDVPDRVDRA